MREAEPSWRKPVGIFAILGLIAVWAAIVASLSTAVGKWPIWLQSVFYVLAGIAWILPLKPLLRWMETGRFRPLDPPSVP
jgi:predicted membrane channel-forming protein YqfA (hemolysin III family)